MNTLLVAALFSSWLPIEDLQVPEGFEVSIFARDVENARQMALGENGTVFVGSRGEGKVYALVDIDRDGVADKQYVVDRGLNMPSGVAYRDGSLYVAAVNRILSYDDIEAHLDDPPDPVVITDSLPDESHHGWKAIEFDDAGKLFIPVGVPCNICIGSDERHGTILRMDVQTGKADIYATGVRNSVGLAFHPDDKALWFTDNGRDWMGDDLPPCEINRASKQGLHFGFPYLHGSSVKDPEYWEHSTRDDYTRPVADLGAHVAPLGLGFYLGDKFPQRYRRGVFVAEHGSWNRSEKTGYRVIFATIEDNRVTNVEDFITGWLDRQEDVAWGRPVDILNLPDGSILVSDDHGDAIYRVTYRAK